MDPTVKEYLFKVIVIGEANVGKTSVIKRYVHNEFSNQYKYTIGVDFALKQIEWDENTTVRIQLWDIAGQERFGIMTHVYYKETTAACVVFDVTSSRSLEAVKKWKSDLDLKVHLPNGSTVPCILIANKCDLPHKLDDQAMNEFAEQHGFVGWYRTSAKSNEGIDAAIEGLIEQIFPVISGEYSPPAHGRFRLTDPPPSAPSSSLSTSRCCGSSSPSKPKIISNERIE